MIFTNYDKIVQSFLNLNLLISNSFFKQTRFVDEKIEAQYMNQRNKSSRRKKIYSDAFIIMSYIAIVAYIYVHGYRNIFAYICLGCLGVSLALIGFSHLKKNARFDLILNHVLVFSMSIYLNWKIMYIAFYVNTPENDNDSEIIRTIIYDFVSASMLAYVTLDTRLSVFVSLFLMNFASTIVAQIKSNSNHFYYMDGLCNFAVSMMFYLFKKAWDSMDRENFAEKHRFEKFYSHTRNFIIGLNGYHLNLSDDFSVCCDFKMKNLLDGMHIDRLTGKSIYENATEKFNELNSLVIINNFDILENYCNLSLDVLKLFISYKEFDMKNQNSNMNKYSLEEKLKLLMLEPSTLYFTNVGKFKLESLVGTKYFEVQFRKFNLSENNSVNDILLYDITELEKSKQKICEEVASKEKMMAKIVHEFKTPINSIIGVIGNIEDSLSVTHIQENKTMKKHLDTIRNLSSYVIFFISDIIHFTNTKSLEEIKIIPVKINLREISIFGFDILKSLLRCNKSKDEAIQPLLEIEDGIDSLDIKADEIRLKQRILNIISNAVKFTKSGWIKIKCLIIKDKQKVILSISDTGIGIPDNEQKKLFNDFQMIRNDNADNALGSGLGLSICKSLASSMNIQITTNSKYGEGSEFSLLIPYNPDSSNNRNLINIFFSESPIKATRKKKSI